MQIEVTEKEAAGIYYRRNLAKVWKKLAIPPGASFLVAILFAILTGDDWYYGLITVFLIIPGLVWSLYKMNQLEKSANKEVECVLGASGPASR